MNQTLTNNMSSICTSYSDLLSSIHQHYIKTAHSGWKFKKKYAKRMKGPELNKVTEFIEEQKFSI